MAQKSPLETQNFFDFCCKTLRGEEVKFNTFKGRVVLVENVASLCDTTTRDYTQMNELVAKFGDKLVILGFPCNQFGHQENANGEEIYQSLKYVRPGKGFVPAFQLMEKCVVNGKNTHPVFQFLRRWLPFPSDDNVSFMNDPKSIIWEPVSRTDLAWNFEKFLITPEGKPHKRFSRYFQTSALQKHIQFLLDQPGTSNSVTESLKL